MNPISIETAASYLAAGLSCLPAARKRKHPSIGSWKTWTDRLPTQIEVEAWFANRQDGICVVAGAVSGNLECIDFDNKGEMYEAWKAKVDAALMARLVVERSPSGGYHVLYRSGKPVDGNLKLARGIRNGKLLTLIETRGEGGLFLCTPTEGYVLVQGRFEEIPLISAKAREGLLNAARSLDEEIRETRPAAPVLANVGQRGGLLVRPGDDFAERGDPRPYLLAAGWTRAGVHPDGNELWVRPGKNPRNGHSATYDGHVFYVFSSNAAPFEPNKGYSAFQVYGLLEHRGNFTQAARSLLDKGYGKAEDPLLGVDLSGFNPPVTQPKGVQQSDFPPVSQGQQSSEEDEDIPIGELVKRYPKLRPPLINGFLRLGETMNIIAPPKTGKSWLVTDLALSVATGTPWFGYPCEKGKVLIIDNELHKETSSSRVPKVVKARGFDMDTVGQDICIFNQRGRLRTIEDIGNKIERYKAKGYKLIIIDAFYRAMPRGTDENDNGAIADVYNMIDRYAQEIGCAFVLIHHTSKGNQSLKSVTDVGAGAGAQSRAADTHVILRRHKQRDVVVMESAVRSFQSVPAMCLRWNWPLWNRDESLNPEDLDGKSELNVRKSGAEQACEAEGILSHIRSLVDEENPVTRTAFVRKLQGTYSLSVSRSRMIFDEAVENGYLRLERKEGLPRNQNSAKFVMLGENTPPEREEEEDDGSSD